MVFTVLNYYFDATNVTNPDGTYPIQFPSATHRPGGGPGYLPDIDLDFSDAIELNGVPGVVYLTDLENALVTWDRFRFRVVFQCPEVSEAGQVLIALGIGGQPIILRLVGENGTIHLRGESGIRSTVTEKTQDLVPGQWYHADLVYDHDTLFVFLDGRVIGVHGFGKRARRENLMSQPAKVIIGDEERSEDGTTLGAFLGSIAGVFLEVQGFQPQLESLTDHARLTAEWYITTKVANIGLVVFPTSPPEFNHRTFAWTQDFDKNFMIMYHSNASLAYTMSGITLDFYRKSLDDDQRNVLGHLMCDQVGDDDKNQIATFSNGAIYQPLNSHTTFMYGQLYLDYQSSGGRRVWGFPVDQPHTIHGGISQEMQNASFFLKDKSVSAHAVRGDILRNYDPDVWGFPVVNEMDIFIKGFSTGQDKMSEFEFCTAYSTPSTGAHAVFEPIRQLYDSMGGPTVLGFPKTDQIPVGSFTAKAQMFNDNIIWTDGNEEAKLILPFSLILQQVSTSQQGMSDNKPYANTSIRYVTGSTGLETALPSIKLPTERKNFGWENSFSGINTAFSSQIVIKDIADSVVVIVSIMDYDTGDDDDPLGDYKFTLDANNQWGFSNPNLKFDSGPLPSHIINVSVELRPIAGPNIPAEIEKFWALPNVATKPLTELDFSDAFLDLSDTRSVQPLKEVREAFYELAIRDMAITGNCFGMCQEAILARKFISPFDFVLSQYNDIGQVIQSWNSKQQYQAGSAAWWWWVDQVISSPPLSPTEVFKLSREENGRGSYPVLTIFDTRLEDNKAHCVYPIHWRGGSTDNTVEIEVLDPMTGITPQIGTIKVNLINDTFEYQNWNSSAGSQLHYIPWELVNRKPCTGTWEQMLCRIDGTVIAMSGDLYIKSIKDRQGNDLSVFGDRARQTINAGRRLDGHFAQLPVYMSGKFPGEILLSRGVAPVGTKDLGGLQPGADPVDLPLQLVDASEPLYPLQQLEALQTTRPGDFRCTVVGQKKSGNNFLKYFAKSNLCHMSIECDLYTEEESQIRGQDIGTTNARYTIYNNRQKQMSVQLLHRMGFTQGGDDKSDDKNDYTSVKIDLKWTNPGRLIIAVKPGLVRVDLFPSTTGILDQAAINIVSVFEQKRREREHVLDSGFLNGVRLKINPAMIDEEIIVTRLRTANIQDVDESIAYF